MTFFEWKESYQTGIAKLDNRHQKLANDFKAL